MALEVVYGESRERMQATALAETLSRTVKDGTLYLGYPVLANADERVDVDGLLVSAEHGLVAFLIGSVPESDAEWEEAISTQDRLYAVLKSNLGRHDNLRRG